MADLEAVLADVSDNDQNFIEDNSHGGDTCQDSSKTLLLSR